MQFCECFFTKIAEKTFRFSSIILFFCSSDAFLQNNIIFLLSSEVDGEVIRGQVQDRKVAHEQYQLAASTGAAASQVSA